MKGQCIYCSWMLKTLNLIFATRSKKISEILSISFALVEKYRDLKSWGFRGPILALNFLGCRIVLSDNANWKPFYFEIKMFHVPK